MAYILFFSKLNKLEFFEIKIGQNIVHTIDEVCTLGVSPSLVSRWREA